MKNKKYKIKAVSLYLDLINERQNEEWEEIIETSTTKENLMYLLSCNNQILSIEEIIESQEEYTEDDIKILHTITEEMIKEDIK